MKRKGTAYIFKCLEQTTLSAFEIAESSFKDKMDENICNPYAFKEGSPAMNKEQSEKARLYLRKCLKEAGITAAAVDKHLGTHGMAGHYFGASQWAFPTFEAYKKMRQIMPTLGEYEAVLKSLGINMCFVKKIYGIKTSLGSED